MSPRDRISATAGALRSVVETERYSDVEHLLADYCRQVETVLRAEPAAPQNTRLAEDSMALFQWMRRTMLAATAHNASRLHQLPPKNAYAAISSRIQTWRVDG